MQTLEKTIRINLHLEGRNWKQEFYTFLRQYRATPHCTTNVSPSELLNNRKLKITIPETPLTRFKQEKFMSKDASANIAQRDAMQKQKQKMKIYAVADQKANAQEREIKPGDIVLMRQPKQNKLVRRRVRRLIFGLV